MPFTNRLYCDRKSKKYIAFLQSERVDARTLQDLFNDGMYYERYIAGEFVACLYHESTPGSQDEPPGTRSLTDY